MESKNEIILIVALVVVFLFLLSGYGMAGFGSYGFGGMMGMMYGTYGPSMMYFGWVYGVLILAVLVLLVMWLFQQIQKK